MEVRYIKPEEAADFQKVSAASFIWKFNAEEDKEVEDEEVECCGNCLC